MLLALLAATATGVFAGGFNNSLRAEPSLVCGPSEIRVEGTTTEPFSGAVYVRRSHRRPGCSSAFEDASGEISHAIPLNELAACGLQIRRRGREVEIFGVFVFSFHPQFVTFADRAFAVHCTFKEDDHPVETGFNLGNLTTSAFLAKTASPPLLHMAIFHEGRPATRVKVGDGLEFVWRLTAASELYSFRILSCSAETRSGKKSEVLQDNCSLDPIAISHLQFDADGSMATATAMAFKFADSEDVWFKCSAKVCLKGGGDEESGDFCSPIEACGVTRRQRRDVSGGQSLEAGLRVDDAYQLDSLQTSVGAWPARVRRKGSRGVATKLRRPQPPWRLCLTRSTFAVLSSLVLLLYVGAGAAVAVAFGLYCHRRGAYQIREVSEVYERGPAMMPWATSPTQLAKTQ